MADQRGPLRQIARPFVADGPTGVSIRDRLKALTAGDEKGCAWSARTWARWPHVIWPAGAVTAWSTPPTRGPGANAT
jgi:hypothetical protein